MSAFLGKIHFWLYKKIRLVISREQLILTKAQLTLGDLADELHDSAVSIYGEPLPEEISLETVIDHSNIHGWLNSQIETASVREASFIKDLIDCGGDDGLQAVLDAFKEQGLACGTVAKDELSESNASLIYTSMQNYYLNGMPCDGGDTIVEDSPEQFQWIGSHDNQRLNWQKAGVDFSIMAQAYQAWFAGFVETASQNTYTFISQEKDGKPLYTIHKI